MAMVDKALRHGSGHIDVAEYTAHSLSLMLVAAMTLVRL
jgi:hypothetical protein